MKISIIFLFLTISIQSMAQSIVCNYNNCSPDSLQVSSAQEKASYSAIDLGFNSVDFSVSTGSGTVIKPLRLNLSNGDFPGKNVDINLSSNLQDKSGGNLVLIGDNINQLTVKLNGYNGDPGKDASKICAENILQNKYGNDVKLSFLQRRSEPGSTLTLDKCSEDDLNDIRQLKFSCNDPIYSPLDKVDPKVEINRVRKVSKCQAILPQNVCYKKTYKITCNYEIFIKDPNIMRNYAQWSQTFYRDGDYPVQATMAGGAFAVQLLRNYVSIYPSHFGIDHSDCRSGNYWTQSQQDNRPLYNDSSYPYRLYDGWNWLSGGGSYNVDYKDSKEIELTQEELAMYGKLNYNSEQICNDKKSLITKTIPNDAQLNLFHIYTFYDSCDSRNSWGGCEGGCAETNRFINKQYSRSSMEWRAITYSSIGEASPGLNVSTGRLDEGGPFSNSSVPNQAYRQTNSANWALDIMPAFYTGPNCNSLSSPVTCSTNSNCEWSSSSNSCVLKPGADSCNPYFTYYRTETSNLVKNIFDPNLYNNNSSFCINKSNPLNCSINPPYCDDPNNPLNCKKISICENINKKTCINPENSANCSINPPYCDDPNDSTNCNSSPVATSDSTKDPFNLASYQYIGDEPDPNKGIETFDCRSTSCKVSFKVNENDYTIDSLQPGAGKNGSIQGNGLVFIYDAQSIVTEANPGQAGRGGLNDLSISNEVRYCANKKDFSTDPGTIYENSPEVNFKKINWKIFDIKGGGTSGQFPPYTENKVEVFKKLDPSIRYLLKKELL